jgi:broad specificity phosphatase PhoE
MQGWCDAPLTARGAAQAEALGAAMADVPLRAIHVSDLTRTRTTAAAVIARHPDVPVRYTADLREWNFGGWEGEPNADAWTPVYLTLGAEYGRPGQHWSAVTSLDALLDAIAASDPEGLAEDAVAVRARVERAIAAMLASAPDGGDVLAVTHGAMLGSLVEALVPGAIDRGVANCAVATVVVDGDRRAFAGFDTRASLG